MPDNPDTNLDPAALEGAARFALSVIRAGGVFELSERLAVEKLTAALGVAYDAPAEPTRDDFVIAALRFCEGVPATELFALPQGGARGYIDKCDVAGCIWCGFETTKADRKAWQAHSLECDRHPLSYAFRLLVLARLAGNLALTVVSGDPLPESMSVGDLYLMLNPEHMSDPERADLFAQADDLLKQAGGGLSLLTPPERAKFSTFGTARMTRAAFGACEKRFVADADGNDPHGVLGGLMPMAPYVYEGEALGERYVVTRVEFTDPIAPEPDPYADGAADAPHPATATACGSCGAGVGEDCKEGCSYHDPAGLIRTEEMIAGEDYGQGDRFNG